MVYEDDAAQPTNPFERLQSLVAPAKEGDVAAIAQIRQLLDDNPGLCQQIGDLGCHVEKAWLGLISGQSPHIRESLERSLAAMRAELATDGSSAIEKLLIDQVIASWLQLRVLELAAASCGADDTSPRRRTASMYKRLDQAQRRHLAAVKSLCEARHMLGDGRQVRLVGPWSGR